MSPYVPTGRPRGRPRKNPLAPKAEADASPAAVPAQPDEPVALEVERRGRGRPAGVKISVVRAIKEKKVVAFRYEGKPRIAEIHAYGPGVAGGGEIALAFQTGGFSRTGKLPGWRRFDLERMEDIVFMVQTFKPRPGYNPADSRFKKVVLKV